VLDLGSKRVNVLNLSSKRVKGVVYFLVGLYFWLYVHTFVNDVTVMVIKPKKKPIYRSVGQRIQRVLVELMATSC